MRGQLLIPWLLVIGGCSFDSSGLNPVLAIGSADARTTAADAAGDRPIDAAAVEPVIDAAGPDARPAEPAACLSDESYKANVFMVAGGNDGGRWNDAPCMHIDYRLRSVCECDNGGEDSDGR